MYLHIHRIIHDGHNWRLLRKIRVCIVWEFLGGYSPKSKLHGCTIWLVSGDIGRLEVLGTRSQVFGIELFGIIGTGTTPRVPETGIHWKFIENSL